CIEKIYHGAEAPELIRKARLLWYDLHTYYQQEWTNFCHYYPRECFTFQQDPLVRAYNQRQEQLRRRGVRLPAWQTPNKGLPSRQSKADLSGSAQKACDTFREIIQLNGKALQSPEVFQSRALRDAEDKLFASPLPLNERRAGGTLKDIWNCHCPIVTGRREIQ